MQMRCDSAPRSLVRISRPRSSGRTRDWAFSCGRLGTAGTSLSPAYSILSCQQLFVTLYSDRPEPFTSPLTVISDKRLVLTLRGKWLGRVRVYINLLSPSAPAQRQPCEQQADDDRTANKRTSQQPQTRNAPTRPDDVWLANGASSDDALNREGLLNPIPWMQKVERDAVGANVECAADESVPAPSASNRHHNE